MIDTKAKRELALKATPGPWAYSPQHIEEGPSAVRRTWDELICTTSSDETSRHIATNDPQSIIAMCDEIDRLRGLVRRMAEWLKPFAYSGNDAAALVEEAKKETEG